MVFLDTSETDSLGEVGGCTFVHEFSLLSVPTYASTKGINHFLLTTQKPKTSPLARYNIIQLFGTDRERYCFQAIQELALAGIRKEQSLCFSPSYLVASEREDSKDKPQLHLHCDCDRRFVITSISCPRGKRYFYNVKG